LASILPTRRWTAGSAEYAGSSIAGDFIPAQILAERIVLECQVVLFRRDNELVGDWFEFTVFERQVTLTERRLVASCHLRLAGPDRRLGE
jgi:hypothetical protein